MQTKKNHEEMSDYQQYERIVRSQCLQNVRIDNPKVIQWTV